MKIIPVCTRSLGANTYILVSGNEALVVDPTVSVEAVVNAAKAENAEIKGILLTHGHFDHVFSLDTLRSELSIGASVHKNDAIMLTDGKTNAFFDFFGRERTYRPAETLLSHMDKIRLGDEEITVLHTPGHTEGSVCYLCDGFMVTGDTLFAESYGRCDLWSGDIQKMRNSLGMLRQLPKDTVIYPGHGELAKLGDALDTVAYLI